MPLYKQVAVVVPDPEAAEAWADANGHRGKAIEALCLDPTFKAAVAASMKEAAAAGKVRSAAVQAGRDG